MCRWIFFGFGLEDWWGLFGQQMNGFSREFGAVCWLVWVREENEKEGVWVVAPMVVVSRKTKEMGLL